MDDGWTLRELALLLGVTVGAAPQFVVRRPALPSSPDPHGLAFCESARYLRMARASGVGAVILPPNLTLEGRPCLRSDEPRETFERFLALWDRPVPAEAGVHPTAVTDPESEIDPTACVGAYCVVERGAVIGAGVTILPFCYVGENCVIGADTVLYPHAALYRDVHIGQRCVVHSHATVGADGFGFSWRRGSWRKLPHVGGVVIGDDVEVGANTTVDRAAFGATRVAAGTKLDNLVQVGHGASIGAHSLICAQSGIAGSAVLGERVKLGGQAAVGDRTVLGEQVNLAGRTATARDILVPGTYLGYPALPLATGLRVTALVGRLPELYARVRALEDS